MRIGKRSLDDLARRWEKARDNGAPISREAIWDDDLPGFGVRRQTVGTGATFVLKYRVKGDTRQRWMTLGEWPAVHPDAAREAAQEIKQAAALGRDLVAERRAEAERAAQERAEAGRRAIPLAEILDAFRASMEAARARKQEAGRSGLHEKELLRLEAKVLRPFLAGQTVGTFDPDTLQTVIDRATGYSKAVHLGVLISRWARFARSYLMERGIKVSWSREYENNHEKPPPRDHRYTLEEAARLWIGAGRLGRRGALVRFLLLTACRASEAQRLRWDYLRLQDSEKGPHVSLPATTVKHLRLTDIPLSPPAVAMLRWLPPRDSRRLGEADLVFAGRGNRPVGGWSQLLAALQREARVPDGILHDIRRTVVSTLADRGWEPAVVDRLLNHAASATMAGVMGVYQRSELWEQQRKAIEAWAELLIGEVGRLQRKPVDPETWGFDQPFEDVQIRRGRKPRVLRRAA